MSQPCDPPTHVTLTPPAAVLMCVCIFLPCVSSQCWIRWLTWADQPLKLSAADPPLAATPTRFAPWKHLLLLAFAAGTQLKQADVRQTGSGPEISDEDGRRSETGPGQAGLGPGKQRQGDAPLPKQAHPPLPRAPPLLLRIFMLAWYFWMDPRFANQRPSERDDDGEQ